MSRFDQAKIRWLPADLGGRQVLPSGPQYSTVARFEDAVVDWPNVAWSIVVEFNEPPKHGEVAVVTIRFLASDAPAELLQPGSRFELLEGNRVVARGEVVE